MARVSEDSRRVEDLKSLFTGLGGPVAVSVRNLTSEFKGRLESEGHVETIMDRVRHFIDTATSADYSEPDDWWRSTLRAFARQQAYLLIGELLGDTLEDIYLRAISYCEIESDPESRQRQREALARLQLLLAEMSGNLQIATYKFLLGISKSETARETGLTVRQVRNLVNRGWGMLVAAAVG